MFWIILHKIKYLWLHIVINDQERELMENKGMFFLRVKFKLINIERLMDTENHYLANTMVIIIVGKNNCEILSWVGKSTMVSKIFS